MMIWPGTTSARSGTTRREFLRRSLAFTFVVADCLPDGAAGSGRTSHLDAAGLEAGQGAERLLGTLPLSRPNAVPLGRLLNTGLDARLFTDLSVLTPDSLTTSNDRFYVRTACPERARDGSSWSIAVNGLVRSPQRLFLSQFQERVEDTGSCLLECSGNGDPNNFGLMSSAAWTGIPLTALVERFGPMPRATHIRIGGVDDEASRSGTSVPGADWIFEIAQLEHAFLATRMNDAPLPRDHGAPVRLIVPGWYGCTCIKWVNEITVLDGTAHATPHMREFAARTHQLGDALLARDFLPATIDHAAVPIRIEKWQAAGGLFYRIVGVLWGGSRPTNALGIRIGTDQPLVRVSDCPLPQSTRTWSLWTHRWTPTAPGRYEITLRVLDPTLPTRRLDALFYRRLVDISET